ncbi:MAG: helix-turn-helix domain-containing protein [Oscillospiraceae bacterium]|nr:helix-turn-helix domain-containing protein [Oscillospiraceae bacterium]
MAEYRQTTVPFMSINATAAVTGLSRNFIRTGCIDGKIPHVKSGCKYLVNVPKLLAMLDLETEVSGE